jgi:(E)-2-((N-methylformamido)methylene)succinate hydrolase
VIKVNSTTPDGTAYQVFGTNGPYVVLVHGLGLNHQSWQWQVPVLAAQYRVVTYDLYGHGASAIPPRKPSLSLFSGQLAGLLDYLGITSAAIAGFSLGGMIARRFAMDHRGKLWALAILHSAHTRDATAQRAVEARVEQARQEGPSATVDAALERWFTAGFRLANPGIMDVVRRWILANHRDVYWTVYNVLAKGVAELVAPEPPITVPTLVMTGEQDYGNSPAMSSAISAEIRGSSLVILPGLRHMALAEAPEQFNHHLLNFIDTVKP